MTFNASPAVRKSMPVLVALYGASGSGKTFSMIRLLKGFERISKKPTYIICTEEGRVLHYAPEAGQKADGVSTFDFVYVKFEPPFTSERYAEAVDYCIKQGAGQIGVDSGSHEWEGEGGVLERQYDTALRMAKGDVGRMEAMNMPAWNAVKKPHNALRMKLGRSPVHQVWCFRAKEKNVIGKDKDTKKQTITNIGFMPVGGTDLIFEFTLSGLLLPGARGVPTWRSDQRGEGVVIKVPKQFEQLTADLKGELSEDLGEALARWGVGGKSATSAKPASPTATPWLFNPEFPEHGGKPVADAGGSVVAAYIVWLGEQAKAAEAAGETKRENGIKLAQQRAEKLFEQLQAEEAMGAGR